MRLLRCSDSGFPGSSQQTTPAIGSLTTLQPQRQYLIQDINQQNSDDFMKSTNSAFSDYNFLFENIDQTLQTNTQLMMEELLLQANHQQTLPPLVLEAARIPGTQVSETTIARNATISMNDVDGARQQDTAGSYIPVTLGEEYYNSPYKNDISEEELISI